jgi:hypothetical protein
MAGAGFVWSHPTVTSVRESTAQGTGHLGHRDICVSDIHEPDRATKDAIQGERDATTALALGFLLPNEKVEQLAANNLTIPQDVIASLLQRLVRHALVGFCVGLERHAPQ